MATASQHCTVYSHSGTPSRPRALTGSLLLGCSTRQQARDRRRVVGGVAASATQVPEPASPTGSAVFKSGAAAQQTHHTFDWRGYLVHYTTAGSGPPVVLVHGFGASHRHFRQNIAVLAGAGYQVFALDLLGQGSSQKPVIDYTMELWRDQICDFMEQFVPGKAVLVGNSIGSLACLMVTDKASDRVAGVCLLNCAGGMNNKAISDDWRIKLALPIFWLIDFLLKQPAIAEKLFNRFRSRDNIRQVLMSVYGNTESVDDELVELIYEPSCDEGALEAFVSILTGPPGPRPDRLLMQQAITQPLLVLWGEADPFTPADGPVGRFFQQLPQQRPNTQFVFLPDTGHCPHDDRAELVHEQLLPWLATVHAP